MTFNIWRFTDGKPGHDSQSIGLCAAIEKLKTCERFDIPVDPFFESFWRLLFKQFPLGEDLPDPNLIIGAGHGTHLPMLSARRARKGKIIVLMKPSLPLSLFDYCLIPKHDLPPEKDNVIATSGALNPIQFNEDKSPNLGLILLGGPSKHYQWDNESIINQIKTIVTNNLDIRWVIADSPRTPNETLSTILKQAYKNVDVLRYCDTETTEIHKLVFKASHIWVSTDSVSMIYESLSSGASVGLLEVPQINNNRIGNAIKTLINDQKLTPFSAWKETKALTTNSYTISEAERCSIQLMERGLLD
jgi:uncharacterized protein